MSDLKVDLDDMLDPILGAFRDTLQAKLTARAVIAYLKGSAQMISWGRTKLTDRPIFFEGPPIRQAIAYANKHAARLVTKMDAETKDRLAKVIGDAIKEKRGIPGLARDIRKEFDDMTKYRSQVIAQTETNDALSAASLDRMKDMEVNGKEWVTVGDDRVSEICMENEAAGIIPVDQPFPSGHMRPPGHVSCRCALAPVLIAL